MGKRGANPEFRLLADAVQDAVAAAIDAGTRPLGCPCGVGYPTGGVPEQAVWVAADFDAAFPRRTSGGFNRDEVAELRVRVLVTMTTDDPRLPRARALELEAAVEDALALDPTLGGLVMEARVSGVSGEEAIPEERKRQYGLTVAVAYSATVQA